MQIGYNSKYAIIHPNGSYMCDFLFLIKLCRISLKEPVSEECSDETFALMNIKARYVGNEPVNV